MVRAMFERALESRSDPERSEKEPLQVPTGLRGLLVEGRRPTLREFLLTDDVAVFTIIRHWADSSRDFVLRYLSRRFLRRRLPKEVGVWRETIPEDTRSLVRSAVRNAFERQTLDDLPAIEGEQLEQALDYLVLGDRSEFEPDLSLEGLLFDFGKDVPRSLNVAENADFELGHAVTGFCMARLYVPDDAIGAVQNALERGAS